MWCTIDNLGDAKAAARDLDILRQALAILKNWHFDDAAGDLGPSINELEAALDAWEEVHG